MQCRKAKDETSFAIMGRKLIQKSIENYALFVCSNANSIKIFLLLNYEHDEALEKESFLHFAGLEAH